MCEKAPEATKSFAITIQELSPGITLEQEISLYSDGANRANMRHRHSSTKDLSYRPPRSARIKGVNANPFISSNGTPSPSSYLGTGDNNDHDENLEANPGITDKGVKTPRDDISSRLVIP